MLVEIGRVEKELTQHRENNCIKVLTQNGETVYIEKSFFENLEIRAERLDHAHIEHRGSTSIDKNQDKEKFFEGKNIQEIVETMLNDIENAEIRISKVPGRNIDRIDIFYKFNSPIGHDKNGNLCQYVKYGVDMQGMLRTCFPQLNIKK